MNTKNNKKVIYYSDELQDDFAITKNITKPKKGQTKTRYNASSWGYFEMSPVCKRRL